jgi:hypothetical protein
MILAQRAARLAAQAERDQSQSSNANAPIAYLKLEKKAGGTPLDFSQCI